MTQNNLASLLQGLLADLREPDIVWQLLGLAACLLLAKAVERLLLRGRGAGGGRAWELGREGLRRIAFPLLAVLLVLVARAAAQPFAHTGLLSLAVPLLGSLALIRMVFYVLRVSLAGAAWLAQFERIFAGLVWILVALHITGLLGDVVAALDAVSFGAGKEKLTLWRLLHGAAAVAATVLLALWASSAIEARLNAVAGLDGNLRVVFARLAKALLILLAVLIGLPMVGIDLTTLSVFGGALGVGLGMGLQRIASNYVSGFIILLDNSIRIGNVIAVGSDRGEVTRITTRYTVLRDPSGVEALVPNELLVGSVVRNESYSDPRVRVALGLQVAYGTDLEQAMALMVDAARAQPRVLAEPAPQVLLKGFGDSGIELELGVWIADPAQGTGQLRSDINLAVWRGFRAAGIEIPYPQREVRVVTEAGGKVIS